MAKARVIIDQDRCKGCLLCVNICPKNVLEIDHSKINAKGYSPSSVKDIDECIVCGNCALMCPDSCISVYKEV